MSAWFLKGAAGECGFLIWLSRQCGSLARRLWPCWTSAGRWSLERRAPFPHEQSPKNGRGMGEVAHTPVLLNSPCRPRSGARLGLCILRVPIHKESRSQRTGGSPQHSSVWEGEVGNGFLLVKGSGPGWGRWMADRQREMGREKSARQRDQREESVHGEWTHGE